MDAEDDGQATPSEVQDLNRDEEAPSEFAIEIEKFRVYLSYRTPTAVLMGGTTGAAIGYYVGDAMALYGYTYAVGLGMSSTVFYSGAYGMKTLRGTDDIYNYAISGTANAGVMGLALGGPRKGLKFAAAGLFGGVVTKYAGDYLYTTFRNSWIDYRRFMLENSKPRILQTRPKMRRPLKGEEFSPREVYNISLFSSEKDDNKNLVDMSKEPTRK